MSAAEINSKWGRGKPAKHRRYSFANRIEKPDQGSAGPVFARHRYRYPVIRMVPQAKFTCACSGVQQPLKAPSLFSAPLSVTLIG